MTEEKNIQVADDLVVEINYTLTVDGEIMDSSKEAGPLAYLHGHANIIPGLESQLTGMKVGESKDVEIAPEDGYGPVDEDAIMDVPLSEFPEDVPLKPGIELEITESEDGDILLATISKVGEETVTLDTNHPLAGKTLSFNVSIADIRAASPEEIDHGHVHFGHDHE